VGLKSGSGAQIGVTTTLASYEFGDENQLVSVTQGTDRRTTFVYDGKRRRRVTREEIKGSSGWGLASETRYVYDGMRVIQERNINGVPPQGSKETWRRFAASRSGPSLQARGIFKRTASSR
jgi:YD repeat-containing protein